nr:carboxypeptidase regulatory-like domain-containing protein [Roseimicrobium gellanilyticum]
MPPSVAQSVPVARPQEEAVPWMLIAAGLWLTGAIAWWICLVAGWLRFRRRVLRPSTPASEGLTHLLAETLVQAGIKSRVQLRMTDKLHTPAICGLWRPVILLPEEAASTLPEEKLRLLLLHELGHTRRMDVMVQVLASLLLGLHWFNPLLWYAHRQLRAEAEEATDAWVLERSGSGETRRYGEVLIDLAARCSWMGWLFFLAPSVIGAAESGSSLRTRIRAISSYRRASRWSVLAGVGCAGVMIATGMTQAPQHEITASEKDKDTNIAEVPKDKATETKETPITRKATPENLATPGFFIAEENKVVLKAGNTFPVPEPRKDMAKDEIGGVVVDEDGKLVAGAKVYARILRRPSGLKNPEAVTSDAEGRWRMKGIPAGMEVSGASGVRGTGPEIKVTVSHPDYVSLDLYYRIPSPGPHIADFRQGKAVLIMEKGLVMKGRVTDTNGKPVANAKVRRGFQERNVDDPTTMTNAEGYYELKHARTGDCRMRIEAKDCAVWMKRVNIEQSGTWDFKLDPAKKLTVRVVDGKGQPIPEAYVVYQGTTHEDHGGGSIAWGTVNDEGKYTWAWTPPRDVTASISHESYQDKKVPVKEQETEVTVTLQARHQITLRILDASTGQLIPNCTVERGQAFPRRRDDMEMQTAWPPNPPLKADAHGMLEDTLREEGELVLYRISAEGYTPFITRVLSAKDHKVVEEVKLRPVKSLAVQILQPDGRPAAGAFVYALLRTRGFVIEDLSVRVHPNLTSSTDAPLEASVEADPNGVCALPSCTDDTSLLVVHESGFATALWTEAPRGTGWKLEPWARAEGTVRDDGKPVAGVEYEYQGSMALPGQHYVSVRFRGKSDAQGQIVMPRVFPAKQAHFAEIIARSNDRVGDYEMKVTRAGETTHFDLTPKGEKSWTVVGRFVTESGPMRDGRTPRSFLVDKERTAAPSASTFKMANVRSDGTFELGPLTSGEYRIQLWDKDKPNFTVKSPLLNLPEVPRGATLAQRRRDIGDVVLVDHASATTKLQTPEGRARFRVTVTDAEGKPLQGASIRPVAYRVKENSGTRMMMKNAVPDLPEEAVLTDASGVAEIACAAKAKDGATLTELQLFVLCEGHVGNYAFFSRANVNSTTSLLKAGTVIAKITRQGKPVESDRVYITSSKESTDADKGFTHEGAGTYKNTSVRAGPLLVQALWKSDEGSLLYSKPMELQVALDKPAACTLELEPGQRLKGRLDSQLPRPVKNARISVCVVNHLKQNENALVSMQDWQEVREDGTFEFTSLPPGQIRVVVLAEGWMHSYESDSWSIVRPLALTMPVPDEVIIPMTRTASCEVTVLGKDGQPLPNVMVTASPALNWDSRANGLLDIHGPRLEQVLSSPLKAIPDWEAYLKTWRSYGVVTDAAGRATITNLPSGSQHLSVISRARKFGDDFNALAEGQSDEIKVGHTGKVILRVQK